MALGFAGQVVAAQMLGADYQILQDEHKVLIDDHELELEFRDFDLVFSWMVTNDREKLTGIVNDKTLEGSAAISRVVTAFEEKVVECIANGIQGRDMSEGGYKRGQLIAIVGGFQNISSEVIKHLAAEGAVTQIVEPLKIRYSEDYKLPINQFHGGWTKHVSAIRMFGGYRYRHVRIDVAAKKERKHKPCPRFLQRQRGEEIGTMPFHRDEWGDVYFPRPIKPINIW